MFKVECRWKGCSQQFKDCMDMYRHVYDFHMEFTLEQLEEAKIEEERQAKEFFAKFSANRQPKTLPGSDKTITKKTELGPCPMPNNGHKRDIQQPMQQPQQQPQQQYPIHPTLTTHQKIQHSQHPQKQLPHALYPQQPTQMVSHPTSQSNPFTFPTMPPKMLSQQFSTGLPNFTQPTQNASDQPPSFSNQYFTPAVPNVSPPIDYSILGNQLSQHNFLRVPRDLSSTPENRKAKHEFRNPHEQRTTLIGSVCAWKGCRKVFPTTQMSIQHYDKVHLKKGEGTSNSPIKLEEY